MNREPIEKTLALIKSRTDVHCIMAHVLKAPNENGAVAEFAPHRLSAQVVQDYNNCGTAACVAGWAALANVDKLDAIIERIDEGFGGAAHYTFLISALFGIDGWTGINLFNMEAVEGEELDDLYSSFSTLVHLVQPEPSSVLTTFDRLPEEVRRRAMVIVLEDLLATETFNWFDATKAACQEYHDRKMGAK